MGLVLDAACCDEIAFVLGVVFWVVPSVLGLLGGKVVCGFGVIVGPFVSKYVHPLFVV